MRQIATWLVIGLSASMTLGQSPKSPPKDPPGAAAEPSSAEKTKNDTPAAQRKVWHPSAAAKLQFRFREVSFDDMPIHEVFENISRAFDVNIVVRWSRLAEMGIERDAAVSLSAKNLRLSQILWLIFNQFDASTVKLAYRADRDMILISTADDLGGAMLVRVYDIEDLVANRIARPTFTAERFHEVITGVVPTVAAGAVAVRPVTQNWGSGIYLNSDDNGSDSPVEDRNANADEDDQSKERRIQQLINVITTTVEPNSWLVNGGNGSILNFRGSLVVRNTPFVHQQLGGPITESE